MDQPRRVTPIARNLVELADAHDLRSVISAALTVKPLDEQSLRRGVWTYVGAERDAGASPGEVIASLSELVEAAGITPNDKQSGNPAPRDSVERGGVLRTSRWSRCRPNRDYG